MSWTSKRHVLTFLAILLCVPLVSFAALSPAGGFPKETQDACKTGSISTTKGKISGGGTNTNNTVEVSNGKVRVECYPTPQGKRATVTYCNKDYCQTYDKASQRGERVMEVYNTVNSQGLSISSAGFQWTILDSSDALQNLLPAVKFQMMEDFTIGKPYGSGDIFGYDTILNDIVNRPYKLSTEGAIDEIIKSTAALPKQASPVVVDLSGQYPPSYNLSYTAGLHDAQLVERQRFYPLQINPDYYSVRAQMPITFEERWSNVTIPSTPVSDVFAGYKTTESGASAPHAPTLFERLRDVVLKIKFW